MVVLMVVNNNNEVFGTSVHFVINELNKLLACYRVYRSCY